MKKRVIIFSILVFAIATCKAQPNAGFEDWHAEFSYLVPDKWQTINFLSVLSPPNPLSCFKTIDKHSGNFAMKLKTIYVNNNPYPSNIEDTMGAAFIGKIVLSPFSYNYGFPYTGRPEKFQFWFMYSPVGNDTAVVGIGLQKWNGHSRDTIAYGAANILSAQTYTLFELPLTYLSADLPDTVAIIFASSKTAHCARVNSTLYLDDLALTGWVGIDEKSRKAGKVKIFPNPARGNINIQMQIEEAENVKIYNTSGKMEGIYKIQNKNVIVNTSLFTTGAYLYEIMDKKNNVLNQGKFDVVQ